MYEMGFGDYTDCYLHHVIVDCVIEKVLSKSSHRRCSIKIDALKSFSKLKGKHLCQSVFFNKVVGLWGRCFSVNFVKILGTPFFVEHFRWLLLFIILC